MSTTTATRITPPRLLSDSVHAGLCSTDRQGHIHQLGPLAVHQRLREAKENLEYWRAARFRALREEDKARAGALATLWQMQIDALEARLNQLIALGAA